MARSADASSSTTRSGVPAAMRYRWLDPGRFPSPQSKGGVDLGGTAASSDAMPIAESIAPSDFSSRVRKDLGRVLPWWSAVRRLAVVPVGSFTGTHHARSRQRSRATRCGARITNDEDTDAAGEGKAVLNGSRAVKMRARCVQTVQH